MAATSSRLPCSWSFRRPLPTPRAPHDPTCHCPTSLLQRRSVATCDGGCYPLQGRVGTHCRAGPVPAAGPGRDPLQGRAGTHCRAGPLGAQTPWPLQGQRLGRVADHNQGLFPGPPSLLVHTMAPVGCVCVCVRVVSCPWMCVGILHLDMCVGGGLLYLLGVDELRACGGRVTSDLWPVALQNTLSTLPWWASAGWPLLPARPSHLSPWERSHGPERGEEGGCPAQPDARKPPAPT